MRGMSYLLGVVLTLSLLVSLTGCSGDGNDGRTQQPPQPPADATTSAVLTVPWDAIGDTLPAGANSVKLSISGSDGFYVTNIVNRPSSNDSVTITFTRVPVGELTLRMVAYPNADAGGIPLASGTTHLVGQGSEALEMTLSLSSTIDHLTMTPATVVLPYGKTQQLQVAALDATGSTVLAPVDDFTWESSDSNIATVSSTGLVTGVIAGDVTITVTQTSTHKTVQAQITVTNDHVFISPTEATIDINESYTFSRSVTGLADPAVEWVVNEANGGGAVTQTGRYTAPNAAGTYHVTARSTVSPTLFATATVTVTDAHVSFTTAPTSTNIGRTVRFTAAVSSTANQAVTWSVAGNGATINRNTGDFTATQAGIYSVTATSVAHPAKSATATIVVTDIRIAIIPANPVVNVGSTIDLDASVQGVVNQAVTWSVEGGVLCGTINAGSGLYQAPITAGTYYIVARSVADPLVSLRFPITVQSTTIIGEIE